jgi:hypothetical protein
VFDSKWSKKLVDLRNGKKQTDEDTEQRASNITRKLQPRNMRYVRHVAHMEEMGNTYKFKSVNLKQKNWDMKA